MKKAEVAVIKTSPRTVLDDYKKIMHLAKYEGYIPKRDETVIKINLSWTKYFPACSTQPWQLEGAVKTMLEDGYLSSKLFPVENKTVVTSPWLGAKNNKWLAILKKHELSFTALPEAEWTVYKFKSKFLKIDKIFPEIEIPKMFIGRNVLHLPTVKTHGHTVTTGSIKNSFGGLLKEVRHYAHEHIHEVLVDLLIMQKEIHKGIFTVMDGTICGDGAGPRTMDPVIKNYILASGDSVAIDAISAKMMGFQPLEIPYIRMCHEMGLGVGDPDKIKILGEDIKGVNFGFVSKKSFVIWGDQMIRKGALRPFKKILLHSPLVVWAPFASNLYHDYFWYPLIGMPRIRAFKKTSWGKLFDKYE